ncbi:MAG: phosphatidate cytidylyltransferase [Fidelibacterota bacterium]
MLVNVLGIPGGLYLLYVGKIYFAVFMTIIMLLALNEFYNIHQKDDLSIQHWLGWGATLGIAWYYFLLPQGSLAFLMVLMVTAILTALIIEMFRNRTHPGRNIGLTLLGIAYIPVLLGMIIALRQYDTASGTRLTMSMVLAIWTCDSLAYAFGKKWGKKKIFPRVSPKKSVVGTIAGLSGAILLLLGLNQVGFLGKDYSWPAVVLLGLITGGFGQVGDFVESMFKRSVGVKDSGTLLQGHGGVLDRFDSMIFASPLVYLFATTF